MRGRAGRAPRRMRRIAAAVLALIFAGAAQGQAEPYAFTDIGDPSLIYEPGAPPAINNLGEVAFHAFVNASVSRIYKGSGGPLTLIAEGGYAFGQPSPLFVRLRPPGSEVHYSPSINDVGQVAFYGQLEATVDDGLFVGDGDTLTTIQDSAGEVLRVGYFWLLDTEVWYEPWINNLGQVAFPYNTVGDPYTSWAYLGDGTTTTVLYDLSTSRFEVFGPPAVNDAGQLAAFAVAPFVPGQEFASDLALTVGDGGPLTDLVVLDSPWWNPLSECSIGFLASINAFGQVAFRSTPPPCPQIGNPPRFSPNPREVRKWDGATFTTIASESGPLGGTTGIVQFGPPAINASGTVAFWAAIDAGGQGIFTGDTVESAIVKTGDALFGSSVTGLEFTRRGLNDAGQIAFAYTLADGRRGVARATPPVAPPPDCSNGLDDDGDGGVDLADAGCADSDDTSERSPTLACDDGIDDDGDGRIDFDPATKADVPAFQAGSGDPGCFDARALLENPKCQNGLNDDGAIGTDFDGGASILSSGSDPNGPDPQCVNKPWRDNEKPDSSCGLGFEIALALGFVQIAARRRLPMREIGRREG